MLKDLFKQIKNRILAKENMANPDSSAYIPIKQNGKTYNLYDLPDGFVIEGDVDLSKKGLTELPDLSKVTVKGNFNCSDNQLTSLTGAPREVGGDFWCYDNQLTTLQGAPQEVGGDFRCDNNKLTTLQGAPQKVGEGFYCRSNELTSLTGAPRVVGGDFDCDKNDNLFSLLGLPQMSGDKKIYCDDDLMERYNCPKTADVGDSYYIKYKDLIESTKYQSELSLHKILQKKHEERAQNDAARKEKLKAGFEEFMKMQTEERE
jgi:hypothetical protein